MEQNLSFVRAGWESTAVSEVVPRDEALPVWQMGHDISPMTEAAYDEEEVA
jgi:hypothetical protein